MQINKGGYTPLHDQGQQEGISAWAHRHAKAIKLVGAALCVTGAVVGLHSLTQSPSDTVATFGTLSENKYEILRNEIDANIRPSNIFRLDRQSLLGFKGQSWIEEEESDTNDATITKHWYGEQIDDHFAPVREQKYWKQKYFVNPSNFKGKGSPVFLYICGEGPCTPGFIGNQRFMADLAKEQGALLIALEHRYYGDSSPRPDMSVHNLRLLSSSQALEDLARFRVWFAKHNDLGYDLEHSQWLSFGGSYAGGLTAWLKMKYSHLFAGSISSSGPVRAQTWFPEYMDIVAKSLHTYRGQPCLDALDSALKEVHDLLQSTEGIRKLEAKFNVCEPMTDAKDYSVFESSLTGQFADSVQYNHQANKVPAEQLCDEMIEGEDKLDILQMIMLRKQNHTCMDVKFEGPRGTIATLSIDTFDGSSAGRQWFWQTCNEFGFFQTAGKTAATNSPFKWLKHMNNDLVAGEVCRRVFSFEEEPMIEETNRMYGGWDIRVDNVTFVNGGIDPWYWLGLHDTSRATESMDVIFIEDGSHCADMRVIPKYDTPVLKEARERIRQNVN